MTCCVAVNSIGHERLLVHINPHLNDVLLASQPHISFSASSFSFVGGEGGMDRSNQSGCQLARQIDFIVQEHEDHDVTAAGHPRVCQKLQNPHPRLGSVTIQLSIPAETGPIGSNYLAVVYLQVTTWQYGTREKKYVGNRIKDWMPFARRVKQNRKSPQKKNPAVLKKS